MPITGIYKITNKKTGWVYIGQSTNCERRKKEHFKQRINIPIDYYITILGKENFDFQILEECDKEDLDIKEQQYIKKYNSREQGYNISQGGSFNYGEGNGRARVTEEDVVFIRKCYNEHKRQKEIYSQYFKNKISFGQFQNIWRGASWSHIMPEVFTEENKRYYSNEASTKAGEVNGRAKLTNELVLSLRKEYVNKTLPIVFQESGLEGIISESAFTKAVRGQTFVKDIPVYRKKEQQWYLNGNPVSTISESGE